MWRKVIIKNEGKYIYIIILTTRYLFFYGDLFQNQIKDKRLNDVLYIIKQNHQYSTISDQIRYVSIQIKQKNIDQSADV